MTCITIFGQKGGTGKTTLCLHFAIEALLQGKKVVVLDNDQQGSATAWGKRRGGPPAVVTAGGKPLPQVVADLRQAYDLVLIDSAPHTQAISTEAARLADFILIPCRPSILDLDAMAPTVSTVQRLKRPAAILLTQCPPNRGLVDEAVSALTRHQVPVCPSTIGARAALSHSMIGGKVAREYDPRGKAAKEIAAAWNWIAEKAS